MNRSTSWIAVLPSLVIPVCFGLMLYLGLSYAIDQEHITNEASLRYLTGHPVSKVTVGMFFIGIASLALIAVDIAEQFFSERKIKLEPIDLDLEVQDSETSTEAVEPESTELRRSAIQHGKQLIAMPKWMRDHYLWQRLISALEYLDRTQETSGVEEELKYLSDLDIDRQQHRYSLVRILIWATPMLGFLGTVLGISQALGGINVGPDNDFQGMMDGLRGSLYIAFDTTALALTLSMLMMFCLFVVERFETQLLLLVDQRARTEIARQYDLTSTKSDQFADQVLEITKESVANQTEVWKKTILAAEEAWKSSLTQANAQVQSNLSESLDENVHNLAHYLGEAIEKADAAMSHRWGQWQITLSDSARILANYQDQLSDQTGTILELIEKGSDKKVFEPAIERNIEAMAATEELRQKINEFSESQNEPKTESPVSEPVINEPEINEPVKSESVVSQAVVSQSPMSESRISERQDVAIVSTAQKSKPEPPQVIVRFPSKRSAGRVRSGNPQQSNDSGSEIILPFSPRQTARSIDESGQRLNKAA